MNRFSRSTVSWKVSSNEGPVEDPSQTVRILDGHGGFITAVEFSQDNRWLVTASDDNTARLWDLTAEDPSQAVQVLAEHNADVRAVAISGDSRWLVTGSFDGNPGGFRR